MLREVLLLNILLCPLVIPKRGPKNKEKELSQEDLGEALISSLRNDVNLDLSIDEDYEDLRAELLAYHTALASLAEDTVTPDITGVVATPQPSGRRSLKTTACWQLGGICIPFKMCNGHKFLTEIPGCKDKLEVCCFTWNKYQTKDFKDNDISNARLPWSNPKEFGGKGIFHPKDANNKNLTPQILQVFNIINKNDPLKIEKYKKKLESGGSVESKENRKNIESEETIEYIKSEENIDNVKSDENEENIETTENMVKVESEANIENEESENNEGSEKNNENEESDDDHENKE